jgi:hypothetical protein
MRRSWLWKGGGLIAAVLALGFTAISSARAQGPPITVPMSVTENREPGLTGSTTITPLGNGMYRVEIRMAGLPPNDTARPAHIHTAAGARCDTGAPVTYPLTNVAVDASGNGTSTTTITVTADKPVTANSAYVNVHNPAQMGRGVFCGNITLSLLAAGAGAAGIPAGTGAAQPAAQRPAAGPAQAAPQAQRPAAAPAAAAQPAAQRPAAAPVAAAPAARPATTTAAAQALPRSGTGLIADTTGAWSMAGLALIATLLAGTGTLAVARRRR